MKGLFFVCLISSLMWGGCRFYSEVKAKQNYLGYLKRAADANSVEMAKTELGKAVTEIERQGLTSGYTSIVYNTPSEDIGFWYNNLKTSFQELQNLPANSSPLEKSNMLIKLRETLLDGGKNGDSITYPAGIQLYPNNTAFAVWGIISIILTILFFLIAGAKNDWFDS